MQAPVFVKSYNLLKWLSGRVNNFPKGHRQLQGKRIYQHGSDLCEHVLLALKGFDRPFNIEKADAALACLILQIRLAYEISLFKENQMIFAMKESEEIGRMIGGWIKRS